MLTFGSLFSGIGGIDLGLERAGMECRWQSEIDPYASRVLAKHWPNTPNLGDVTEIDWTNVERTDVVAGGYPCQPFSVAGRREGDTDSRHLWPHFATAIRVLRPRYALLENVSGHLSLGFGHVLADLAALGYDCRWDCIPAAAVGAPHLRDRVLIIARDTRTEQRRNVANSDNRRSRDPFRTRWHAPWHGSAAMANTERVGTQIQTARRHTTVTQPERVTQWQTEPDVGRMANGVPARLDRLRGLGNAVVPQVAEHVARIIMQDAQ